MFSLVTECLNSTAAHGLPRLVKTEYTPTFRCLWGVFISASFIVLTFHSSTLVKQYFDEPTTVNIIPRGTDFLMPDMYICNQNPLSFSSIEYTNYFPEMELQKIKRIENFNMQHKERVFWETLSWSDIYRNFGHIKEQDIINSMFLKPRLEMVPHWTHFICYKYKSYTIKPGETRSTSFLLYADTSNTKESTVKYSDSPLADVDFENSNHADDMIAGFKIYVVPADEYPHPESPHVIVTAGYKTEISITMEQHDLLSNPTFPCSKDRTWVKYYNPIETNKPLKYKVTSKDCVYEKFHREAMKTCECTWFKYPINIELIPMMGGKPRFCLDLNNKSPYESMGELSQKYGCLLNISHNLNIFEKECLYTNPCLTHVYKPNYQINKWPVINQLHKIKETVLTYLFINEQPFLRNYKMPGLNYLKNTYNFNNFKKLNMSMVIMFREEIAKMRIAWPERKSLVMKETYSYQFKNLASDIGGIFGFYLGVSVLTILELFDLALRMISSLFNLIKASDKQCSDVTLEDAS